ncbi:MAG: carboxypeptidase-like regulatory domain-containing protein, partial [Bacteroidota bacterium]
MKRKLSFLSLLVVLMCTAVSYGQEKAISGTVTDSDGLPLPGVNIVVEGTSNGTQTDFDGNYT